ncbi:MAG: hypothetical protein LLG09_02100 [Negativicutes bacterium]|nr:hypothetical protein [Negativicutes bacterium]
MSSVIFYKQACVCRLPNRPVQAAVHGSPASADRLFLPAGGTAECRHVLCQAGMDAQAEIYCGFC